MGMITMGIPESITLQLAAAGNCTVFIETGTFRGGTTRWASSHFPTVHTIERAEGLYREHSPGLSLLPGVTPHLGDSRDILPGLVAELGDRSAVLWLDGHWSGGETSGEGDECPLLDELRALTGRVNDVILIDDARLFVCAPPAPHQPSQWPTLLDIARALPDRGDHHFLQVVDDVIFIVPDRPELKTPLVSYAQQRSAAYWAEYTKQTKTKRSMLRRMVSSF